MQFKNHFDPDCQKYCAQTLTCWHFFEAHPKLLINIVSLYSFVFMSLPICYPRLILQLEEHCFVLCLYST